MTNNINNTNNFAPVSGKLTLENIIKNLRDGADFEKTAETYSATTGRSLSRELFDLASVNASLISGEDSVFPIHWNGFDFQLDVTLRAGNEGCLEFFYFRWEPGTSAEYDTSCELFESVIDSDTPYGQLVLEEETGRIWYQALYIPLLYSPEFYVAALCGAIEETAYYIERLEECRI